MIVDWNINVKDHLADMFKHHRPHYFIDSVIQGNIGKIETDSSYKTNVVKLSIGELVVFGGNPKHPKAEELVKNITFPSVILPSPEEWMDLYQMIHKNSIVAKMKRFEYSSKNINREKIDELSKSLTKEYSIKKIDYETAKLIFNNPSIIGEDHIRNFNTPENFIEKGYGYIATHKDIIIGCVTTCAICSKGIEIQINTKEQYKRKGVATALSATLIKETFERGLDPHWDTGNNISMRLAEKLGYEFTDRYEVIICDK